MLIFEPFKPSARQLAMRQRDEAQRLAIKHAAEYEEFTAAASASSAKVRMYQDRAARLNSVLGNDPKADSLDPITLGGAQ